MLRLEKQAEILAFATIMFPFVVAIGVTAENEASFLANLFAGIVVFSLFVVGYLILDVLFWIFVHKNGTMRNVYINCANNKESLAW